jgi:AcrR family transcriptional regulator
MQYLSQRLAEKPARARGGGPPRDPLAARQRERLLAAAERLIAERGCAGTSIEATVKLARVSSVTFYEHFAGKEECFVAAFERAVAETRAELREAIPGGAPWPDQVRAALAALLAAIVAEPARARMCLVEAGVGGPALRARYDAALDAVASELREGRVLDSAPPGLPATLEEATVGSIAWLLRERLEAGDADGVEGLLPRLVDLTLSPYLDGEAPRAVAEPVGADG